jgi:hypothetical protein
VSTQQTTNEIASTEKLLQPFDLSAEREEAERRAKGKRYATAHSTSTTGETYWSDSDSSGSPFRDSQAAHSLDNDLEHPDSDSLAYSTPSATRKQHARQKRDTIRLVYTGFSDILPMFVTENRVAEAVRSMEIPSSLAPYGGIRLATVAGIIRIWRERADDEDIYTEEFRTCAKEEFANTQVKWSRCLSKAFEEAQEGA